LLSLLGQAERECRQWQEELGLDHFEGRSWRGFHHHACLVMLACGFRLKEQERKADTALADVTQSACS
jgi:SRSO17 transposase